MIIKVNGKWRELEYPFRFLEPATICDTDGTTKPPKYAEDLLVIQRPYDIMTKDIIYSEEYLNAIGKNTSILRMYSELMEQFPDRHYILLSEERETLEPRFLGVKEIKIKYKWVIK